MNSVRPLATITILTVVGVFLYMKINEGTQFDSESASDSWDTSPPAFGTTEDAGQAMSGGLASTVDASQSTESAAPTWAPQVSTGAPASPSVAASTVLTPAAPVETPPLAAQTPPAPATLPAVPSIPELPPLPATPNEAQTVASPPPLTLPANIPTAQYSDSPVATTPPTPEVSGQVPSLGTATPDIATAPTSLPPPPTAERVLPSHQPAAVATTPTPTATPFTVARPAIDTALERGELSRAHALLSQWQRDASLTAAEQSEVDNLLNQLAGTVIYSNEHRLEPAYTVKAGETLETIAQQYKVPWQLLAKINGIARADAVQPGQQIKVLRGPFTAEVSLSSRKLTLQIDGRYAGRFAVSPPAGAAIGEGEWVVDQKLLSPVTQAVTQASTAFAQNAPAVQRAVVLKSIAGETPGSTLVLGPTAPSQLVPGAAAPAAIQVSSRDADDLCDILSVGSRVVIRR